jgi:hypothetical protein
MDVPLGGGVALKRGATLRLGVLGQSWRKTEMTKGTEDEKDVVGRITFSGGHRTPHLDDSIWSLLEATYPQGNNDRDRDVSIDEAIERLERFMITRMVDGQMKHDVFLLCAKVSRLRSQGGEY